MLERCCCTLVLRSGRRANGESRCFSTSARLSSTWNRSSPMTESLRRLVSFVRLEGGHMYRGLLAVLVLLLSGCQPQPGSPISSVSPPAAAAPRFRDAQDIDRQLVGMLK